MSYESYAMRTLDMTGKNILNDDHDSHHNDRGRDDEDYNSNNSDTDYGC